MAMICITGGKECDGCMCCQDIYASTYCEICGHPITDHYYEVMGMVYCASCMDDMFRKDVD